MDLIFKGFRDYIVKIYLSYSKWVRKCFSHIANQIGYVLKLGKWAKLGTRHFLCVETKRKGQHVKCFSASVACKKRKNGVATVCSDNLTRNTVMSLRQCRKCSALRIITNNLSCLLWTWQYSKTISPRHTLTRWCYNIDGSVGPLTPNLLSTVISVGPRISAQC